MEELQSKFDQVAKLVVNLQQEPTTDEKLQLYGLYKQVTVGDCNISEPWAVQIEAKQKYNAWNKNKGMFKTSAIEKYILLALNLIKKYKLKE
jgi:diazepam-binding inhibitor (GABA receptor modulating acyl-CoA-binding protein)